MSTKTISMFLPNLSGGGAERVMVNLANGLSERGHQVDMVLLRRVGPYLADLTSAVRVVDLGSRTVRSGVVPLARYLRFRKPDVLLSALDYANTGAMLASRLAGVATRLVLTVHTTHSQVTAHQGSLHHALVRAAMRLTYPKADAIVAVSRGAADDMIKSTDVPSSLVRVIYNPVISSRLKSLALEPVDDPWFTEDKSPTIVAMGRLTQPKDYPTLFRAVASIKDEEFRLVVLGEGEERGHLEEMIGQLGLARKVRLIGFVRNPFAYLARADLFVLSSAWEALPTVLIEALALGVPVVSTDCESGPGEILKGGVYGRLVPVGDVEAMAHAIRLTLHEPRPTIPAAALRSYTYDTAIGKYESLILQLTRAVPRPSGAMAGA